MGIRPDWPLLVSILNKGLTYIGTEGLRKIVAKWAYHPPEQEVQIDITAEEQAWLVQNHTIKVRVMSWSPFLGIGEKEFWDVSFDYLDLIVKRTGGRI